MDAAITSILPKLKPELVKSIIEAFDEAGVDDAKDLYLVEEKHFRGLLKELQIKKLLLEWEKLGEYFISSSACIHYSASSFNSS
jgi:hypothetical protein